MVGNGVEADSATWAFSNYWEENAALVGSVLVYNTGRSLGQFIGLHQEKGGALALPDALITAVGTKVQFLTVLTSLEIPSSAEFLHIRSCKKMSYLQQPFILAMSKSQTPSLRS